MTSATPDAGAWTSVSTLLVTEPLHQLAQFLRAGVLTSLELVDAALERIQDHDTALRSLVHVGVSAAREEAGRADDRRARGHSGHLLGIPCTVKDNLAVAGMPTGNGAPGHERSRSDSAAVARLRRSGAVVVGKSNLPLLGTDWQTESPAGGRTNNPWNLTRTPGGSGGGGAAAVAARLVPADLGTDTAGSLSIPASFCGIYAHRPTLQVPARPTPGRLPRLAQPGVFAWDPRDLGILANVLTSKEDRVAPGQWERARPPLAILAGLRVAFLKPQTLIRNTEAIDEAMSSVADLVARAGGEVAWVEPSLPGGLPHLWTTFLRIAAAHTVEGMDRGDHARFVHDLRASADWQDDAWADGLTGSRSRHASWRKDADELRAAMSGFFDDWDHLVLPVAPVLAFEHDSSLGRDWFSMLVSGGVTQRYNVLFLNPALAALLGTPATTFPVGITPCGLPVGLQALSRWGEDDRGITLVAALALLTGPVGPPPFTHLPDRSISEPDREHT